MLDEADYYLFECKAMPPPAYFVLGFTATKFKPQPSIEAQYLEALGVKTFDSKIQQSYTSHSYDPIDSFEDFFDTTKRAKLIYTSETQVEKITHLAKKNGYERILQNCKNLEIIANIRPTDCLIITSNSFLLLRGVDYRCRTGADLLIAESLPSERSLVQALGRVGRANDDCERYLLKSIEPINKGKECELVGNLKILTRKIIAAKVQARKDRTNQIKIEKQAQSKQSSSTSSPIRGTTTTNN